MDPVQQKQKRRIQLPEINIEKHRIGNCTLLRARRHIERRLQAIARSDAHEHDALYHVTKPAKTLHRYHV